MSGTVGIAPMPSVRVYSSRTLVVYLPWTPRKLSGLVHLRSVEPAVGLRALFHIVNHRLTMDGTTGTKGPDDLPLVPVSVSPCLIVKAECTRRDD